MKKNKFNKDDVIDLLIKKASGFYYTEEVFEYEKTQNNSKLNKNIAILPNSDMVNTQINFFNDNIKSTNEKHLQEKEDSKNLTLTKKKIATHFVSPDMLAIKMLFEIYGKKVGDDNIETLTDEELINLKNKLIGELINEDDERKSTD